MRPIGWRSQYLKSKVLPVPNFLTHFQENLPIIILNSSSWHEKIKSHTQEEDPKKTDL